MTKLRTAPPEKDMKQASVTGTMPAKPYSWFVGIPICTNPIIALDAMLVAAVLWGGGMLFIMLGQATIGDGLTRGAITAAFHISMYLALAALAAYLFVGLLLLSNRYAALYRIDAHGVYCEYMRGSIRAVTRVFLPWRGFAVEPLREPSRTVEKRFGWNEIRSLQLMEGMRVIVLKGRRGTLTKIYCPDQSVFRDAAERLRNNLSG